MLITAHLASATHTSSFAGPHVAVEVTACFHPEAAAGRGVGPAPGHHHHADTHVDHAVDRPRTEGDDAVVGSAGGLPCGLPGETGAALPAVPHRGRAFTAERGAAGHAVLALHCVWRL